MMTLMGMLTMMMAIMLLFIQVRGAESDETREARLAQDRIHTAEVIDDDVDGHVNDNDGVHVHVLMAGSGEGS